MNSDVNISCDVSVVVVVISDIIGTGSDLIMCPVGLSMTQVMVLWTCCRNILHQFIQSPELVHVNVEDLISC